MLNRLMNYQDTGSDYVEIYHLEYHWMVMTFSISVKMNYIYKWTIIKSTQSTQIIYGVKVENA